MLKKTWEFDNTTMAFVLQQIRGNTKQPFTVSGTGHDDLLKAVDLPIVSNERCREMHRGNLHITNTKICAGGTRDEGVCEVNCYLFILIFPVRSLTI